MGGLASMPSRQTTIKQALASYAALEALCRRDPCAGIDAQVQIFGLNPKALAYAYAVRHGSYDDGGDGSTHDTVRAAVARQRGY